MLRPLLEGYMTPSQVLATPWQDAASEDLGVDRRASGAAQRCAGRRWRPPPLLQLARGLAARHSRALGV